MQVFIAGTDTDIGKTIISSWITIHTGFAYFKPVQTGSKYGTDSIEIAKLTNKQTYQESFCYQEPLSPHIAASLENQEIDIDKIILPTTQNLIVEGAGGLLVPINKNYLMIDLITKFQIPVILVSRIKLGVINHTLLSLEALRARNVNILGTVLNGATNKFFTSSCKESIEFYGKTQILAEFPFIKNPTYEKLKQIPLSKKLEKALAGNNHDII